ncbi:hypothetical protein IY972_06340 [Campylobacter volucris]|uniref:DUF7768 domain-containing protein n=1 Tax=Campylobacter TaxID=194 RepID=UPI00189FD2FB|nr:MULTISPECIES: DUF4406 domain-containing protein [Campylobacter]MBF7060514.1 hypothetical protein [Campylobacter volucris]MCR6593599.1 hypothetical protein [Campylobacter insulaenigrae]
MAIVYIASPYKALAVRESQRKAQAISIATQECLKIMRECEGFTPISPILQFSYLDEEKHREIALKMGLELLKASDYIYMSTHEDAKYSQGMQEELALAKKLGIKELTLDLPL